MNLETLSIEDLAVLRDKVILTLADKVTARQKALLAESERVGALITSKPSTARPKRPAKYQKGSLRSQAKLRRKGQTSRYLTDADPTSLFPAISRPKGTYKYGAPTVPVRLPAKTCGRG